MSFLLLSWSWLRYLLLYLGHLNARGGQKERERRGAQPGTMLPLGHSSLTTAWLYLCSQRPRFKATGPSKGKPVKSRILSQFSLFRAAGFCHGCQLMTRKLSLRSRLNTFEDQSALSGEKYCMHFQSECWSKWAPSAAQLLGD